MKKPKNNLRVETTPRCISPDNTQMIRSASEGYGDTFATLSPPDRIHQAVKHARVERDESTPLISVSPPKIKHVRKEKSQVFMSHWDSKIEPRKKQASIMTSYWDLNKQANETPSGTIEYNACPSLSVKQQYQMEYGLPLVLPGIFYFSNLSSFGLHWSIIIVAGHTLETMMTNFGKLEESNRQLHAAGILNSLQHHLFDCIWLHTIITAMFICPGLFGSHVRVFYIGLMLIQTLPIYLAVSFKSHYCNQTSSRKEAIRPENVGLHIRHCFLFYLLATMSISISRLLDRNWERNMCLLGGLLVFNIAPMHLTNSYLKLQEHNAILIEV